MTFSSWLAYSGSIKMDTIADVTRFMCQLKEKECNEKDYSAQEQIENEISLIWYVLRATGKNAQFYRDEKGAWAVKLYDC